MDRGEQAGRIAQTVAQRRDGDGHAARQYCRLRPRWPTRRPADCLHRFVVRTAAQRARTHRGHAFVTRLRPTLLAGLTGRIGGAEVDGRTISVNDLHVARIASESSLRPAQVRAAAELLEGGASV